MQKKEPDVNEKVYQFQLKKIQKKLNQKKKIDSSDDDVEITQGANSIPSGDECVNMLNGMVQTYPKIGSDNHKFKYTFDAIYNLLLDNLKIEVRSSTEDIIKTVNFEYNETEYVSSKKMSFSVFDYDALQHMTEEKTDKIKFRIKCSSNVVLYYCDLFLLKDECWLNDLILNAHIEKCEEDYKNDNILVLQTYFWSKLDGGDLVGARNFFTKILVNLQNIQSCTR